eukprot:3640844-Rhodomonas_salina.1
MVLSFTPVGGKDIAKYGLPTHGIRKQEREQEDAIMDNIKDYSRRAGKLLLSDFVLGEGVQGGARA